MSRWGASMRLPTLSLKAIMNASGSGMDTVIFQGGIKGFRTLYPEYNLLPDEILADAVRRRYFPKFSKME